MDWYTFLTDMFATGHLSYLLVFVILILCGLGLPIPEEVTFIVAGIVVDRIDGQLGLMIVVSVIGILAGDSVTFYLGRRYGESLLSRWPFKKLMTQKNLQRSRDFFRRHGSKAIFIAGCLAGVRAPTFFLSATMGVSYWRFLLWDFARAMITCPISIYLGYKFGKEAEERLGPYKHYLFGAIVIIALFFVVREIRMHRRDQQEDEKMAEVPAIDSPAQPTADPKPERLASKDD
ncbi:MAG: VTT domain-containing protein [Planctomycetota bacterium]|nr:VTT domain-containing protein [Planctomycetota bacterium]